MRLCCLITPHPWVRMLFHILSPHGNSLKWRLSSLLQMKGDSERSCNQWQSWNWIQNDWLCVQSFFLSIQFMCLSQLTRSRPSPCGEHMLKGWPCMPIPTTGHLEAPGCPLRKYELTKPCPARPGAPGALAVRASDHTKPCSALRLSHLWTFRLGHSVASCYLSYSISEFLGDLPQPFVKETCWLKTSLMKHPELICFFTFIFTSQVRVISFPVLCLTKERALVSENTLYARH